MTKRDELSKAGETQPAAIVDIVEDVGTVKSVTVTLAIGSLDPQTIWDEKDRWIASEKQSLEVWQMLDEDARANIIEVVDRSLQRMRDRVEVWVPASLDIKQGDYIDINLRLIFSDVEREKQAKMELTERRLEEARREAAQLVEEVGGAAA